MFCLGRLSFCWLCYLLLTLEGPGGRFKVDSVRDFRSSTGHRNVKIGCFVLSFIRSIVPRFWRHQQRYNLLFWRLKILADASGSTVCWTFDRPLGHRNVKIGCFVLSFHRSIVPTFWRQQQPYNILFWRLKVLADASRSAVCWIFDRPLGHRNVIETTGFWWGIKELK